MTRFRLDTKEIKPLAGDERRFDAKIVSSALEFLGRYYRPLVEADVADAASAFSWVPDVIGARAFGVGAELKPYELATPRRADDCNTLATRFWLAVCSLQETGDPRDAPTHHSENVWLSKHLSPLAFSEHPVYRNASWTRISIPVLRSVEHCIAYAIFLLLEDRWDFRDRVHECPYRKRQDRSNHFEPSHWFLDYRLNPDGTLARGQPLRFCTPSHASAFRQREHRRKIAARHK